MSDEAAGASRARTGCAEASREPGRSDGPLHAARLRAVAEEIGWSVFEDSPGRGMPGDDPGPTGVPIDTWDILARFMDAAPDGVILVDERSVIRVANRMMGDLFRTSPTRLRGMRVETLFPDGLQDEHARCQRRWASRPEKRECRPVGDLSARRLDGTRFPADVVLSPFQTRGGNYVVMAVRDATARAAQQAELRRSEARFRAMIDGAGVGIAILTPTGRVQLANQALSEILARPANELLGCDMASLLHPADARVARDERLELQQGHRDRLQAELRFVRPDGGVRHLRVNFALVRNALGEPDFVIAVHEDATEQRRTEKALQARTLDLLQLLGRAANESHSLEEAMQLCIRHVCQSLDWPVGHALVRAPSGTLVPSEHWCVLDEPRYARLREVTLSEWTLGDAPPVADLVAGVPVWLDARPHRTDSPRRRVCEALGLTTRVCIPILSPDGVVAALEFFSPHAPGAEGVLGDAMARIGAHLGRLLERRRAHEQLEHLALHDGLTGLPNRLLFLDRLQHAIARLGRSSRRVAVYFMDLDGLKDVNDTLGHAAGDELLCAIARRLTALVRPEDTIARLGGDEFTLLCENVADADEAKAIARRIVEGVSRPIAIRGVEFDSSVSVGMSVVDDPATGPEDVLRDADAAMYAAKSRGGGTIEWAPSVTRSVRRRSSARSHSHRRTLREAELRLHYQPCVSLPSRAVVGFEALVRWQHPRRGLLAPCHFIPLAERNGSIEALGEWVLREACRQVARWQRESRWDGPLDLQVNVSSHQFATGRLVSVVREALAESRLAPRSLLLEITESVMLSDSAAVLQQLRALRAQGVRISADDFGTGYSSLHYIQQLPLQQLKLDRSFVAGLPTNPSSRAIVSSLIHLAHALDIEVVAEGVEREAQCEALVSLGCDRAQGFLFGRPSRARDLERPAPRVSNARQRGRPGATSTTRSDRAPSPPALAPEPALVRARRRAAA